MADAQAERAPVNQTPVNQAQLNRARLSLQGMTCASCVGRVERVLRALPGVSQAQVNLGTETAQVEFAAPASLPQMAQALDKAGYPLRQEVVTLSVEGMTCASCTARVERVLKAQPGVADAVVNLATRRAEVTLWQAVPAAVLAAAVSKAGYAAVPLSASSGPDQKAELAGLWRQVWFAAALTLPVFLVEMGGHLLPRVSPLGDGAGRHAERCGLREFVLVTLVLFGPGWRFFKKGVPALLRAAPDMNSLVAVGTFAAWGYSSLVVFVPGLIPRGLARGVFRGGGGDRGADPAGPRAGDAGARSGGGGDCAAGGIGTTPCAAGQGRGV